MKASACRTCTRKFIMQEDVQREVKRLSHVRWVLESMLHFACFNMLLDHDMIDEKLE